MRYWPFGGRGEAVELTCYTKAGCCLCERAEEALARMERRGMVRVTYVPIQDDPALLERYGQRIPVVCQADDVLAEGKVSELWLSRALEARRASARRT